MPDTSQPWAAGEPAIGSIIDTLRIETIGYLPAKAESIHTRFPFAGIGLVLRGAGYFGIDDQPARTFTAPAVFFIRPGPVFHYGPESGSVWEERYLCFSGPRVADWQRWGWLSASERPCPLAEPDALAQMHRRICRAFAPFQEIPLDQAKLELEQLIHAISRQAFSHSQNKDKLGVLIEHWIKDPAAAGELRAAARALGMSYSGFRHHFARRTGLTPHQFLLRLRIDQASVRLAQTVDPVKAIAFDCGFVFVESFNRAFRQVKGITPGEYRRRMGLLMRRAG
jgi:AraC family transcriptional regulator of arabinose operon